MSALLLFLGAILRRAQSILGLFRVWRRLNAAVGGWARILAVMFLRTPVKAPNPRGSRAAYAAVVACAVLTLIFGIYPKPLARVTSSIIKPPVPAAMLGQ